MANKDNLIPLSKRSHEEVVEIGRKGGLSYAKKAKERASMRKDLLYLLDKSLKSGMYLTPEQFEALGMHYGKSITTQQAIMISMINEAIQGDVHAAEFIRDTAGEKPTDKVELGMTIEEYVKNHKVKL